MRDAENASSDDSSDDDSSDDDSSDDDSSSDDSSDEDSSDDDSSDEDSSDDSSDDDSSDDSTDDDSSDDDSSDDDSSDDGRDRLNKKGKRKRGVPSTPEPLRIFSSRNIAIPIFYWLLSFTQGCLLPIMDDLPRELGASSAELNNIETIFYLPLYFKIFLAFLTDALPIQGYRRRPYIFVGWLIAVLFVISLAALADANHKPGDPPSDNAPSVGFLSTVLFFYGFGSAMSSVCIDAMVVEKYMIEDEKGKGKFLAACQAFKFFGFIVAVPIGPAIYGEFGSAGLLIVLTVFPLLALSLLHPLQEDSYAKRKKSGRTPAKRVLLNVWDACKSRSVYQTVGSLFLYLVFQVQFTRLNDYLEFSGISDTEINISTILGIGAMLLAILFYRLVLLQKPWKFMLSVTTGLSVATTLLYLFVVRGSSGYPLVLFAKMATGFVDGLELLPVVLLLNEISSVEGSEATCYAVVSSITNFALATSQSMSVAIQELFNVSSESFETGTTGSLTGMVLFLAFLPVLSIMGVMHVPKDRAMLASWRETKKMSRGFVLVGVVIMSVIYSLIVALVNFIVYQVVIA